MDETLLHAARRSEAFAEDLDLPPAPQPLPRPQRPPRRGPRWPLYAWTLPLLLALLGGGAALWPLAG